MYSNLIHKDKVPVKLFGAYANSRKKLKQQHLDFIKDYISRN